MTLTKDEREQLLTFLEKALRDKKIEVHRTEAPDFREIVEREESLLEGLIDQLRQPREGMTHA